MKNFLTINETGVEELNNLLELSFELKKIYKSGGRDLCLAGKTLAMLFEKPSLRTRMSFQVAMTQLGGDAIFMDGRIGQREPLKDMARTLSRYVEGIMARTFEHKTIIELARYSSVPVINALSDLSHPCQAMADVMTIKEHFGKLNGITLAYIGDGNNVARSLAYACAKLGLKMIIASPAGYELNEKSVAHANSIAAGSCTQISDPAQAVKKADIIYTDTWTSMGQEEEKQKRIEAFKGFTVDMTLLKKAPQHVKIMHCLPAYRGYEITDEAAESANSIIFDQAENRLHFQRALLKKLMS